VCVWEGVVLFGSIKHTPLALRLPGSSQPPRPPTSPFTHDAPTPKRDTAAPTEPIPAQPRPEPKGELDFLADGLSNQQQQHNSFEPGAFENGGHPQQQQQQQGYYDPNSQQPGYGGYPGYAPQMTGYPGYAPQMTGYGYGGYPGYAPQMTGAPNSMALVAVGEFGLGGV